MRELDNSPMGHEDAQDRDDIESSYIDVTSLVSHVSLSSSRLHEAKIVVGRKGSGKTHVLLHMRQIARKDGREVVYCHLNRDMFVNKGLQPYRGNRTPEESVILWTDVWRVALSIAAMSQFTARRATPRARDAVRDSIEALDIEAGSDALKAFREEMKSRYDELVPDIPYALDPIEVIEYLTKRYRNLQSLLMFLDQARTSEIEADISVILHNFGTIHFMIDGLDEFAWADPKGWLDIQVGLFNTTFLLSTVRRYTQYLKLSISLRNYVFTRAAQSTHIDRARSHIIRLTWDAAAARTFLDRRLSKLAGGNFARSELLSQPRPLAAWLGFEQVNSGRRNVSEDVEQYLLRHSRLSPRNLVEVFNSLCAAQNARERLGTCLDADEFKSIVEDQARSVASLALKVCAEELLANLPNLADQRRKTLAPEYEISEISSKIALCIAECNNEVIDRNTCSTVLIAGLSKKLGYQEDDEFSEVCKDVEAILWRSGLFAYRQSGEDGSRWLFSWSSIDLGPAGQPLLAREIGFHSCLIGFCSLEVSRNGPVF